MRGVASVRHPLTRSLLVLTFTTGLTGTLTALATGLTVAGGRGEGTTRRLATVGAMLVGAIAGALLVKTGVSLPVGIAAALALVTWLAYVPAAAKLGR